MTPENVMAMGFQAIKVSFLISAPLLLASLIVGLLISIFQAATQINEMTLSFIPKIMAILVIIILLGPWMLNVLIDYIHTLFTNLPYTIG